MAEEDIAQLTLAAELKASTHIYRVDYEVLIDIPELEIGKTWEPEEVVVGAGPDAMVAIQKAKDWAYEGSDETMTIHGFRLCGVRRLAIVEVI